MERRNVDEKLNAPGDFVASGLARSNQGGLMTPSHFTACPQSAPALPGLSGSREARMTWVPPAKVPATGPGPNNPLKQEILELRRENRRLLELHGEPARGQSLSPLEDLASRSRSVADSERLTRCRAETEWRVDTERLRADVERLRGQLEALKEASGRQRDEIRDRESTLNRQSYELQEVRAELCRTKAELARTGAELDQSKLESGRRSLQLERLTKESEDELDRLRREVEKSGLEVQRLRVELEKQETEAASRLEALRLKEELEDLQRRRQMELSELSVKHQAEVSSQRQACADLQDKLSKTSQERDRLEGCVQQAGLERDSLREELSQMRSAFDTQSSTLQSLRNYIGQLAPQRQEEEQLAAAVQRLEREKEALQVTAELLTVRLDTLNDILAMQEREMEEKVLSDPLSRTSSKGRKVLRCWREKVFVLLVQLRSKDIQQRGDKARLVAAISTLEEEVRQQTYQTSFLQRSLQDKTAELDLERVGRQISDAVGETLDLAFQTVELELAQIREENERLKGWAQEAKLALRTITQDVQRSSLVLEAKMAEVLAAQTRLLNLGQRLAFAKGRIDTIQGLMMRKEALWKVQQTTKQMEATPERSCCDQLKAELTLMSEERDRLAQELKRTPELIERVLSESRQQFNAELQQLRLSLQESREEALELEQGLQKALGEAQERGREVDELRAELIHQQETSAKSLEVKVTETEARCAKQLGEMESQLNACRREHTKAVVALRQWERQAERERERGREMQMIQEEQMRKEVEDLQRLLQETDRDRNLLWATVRENGLLNQYKKARTTPIQTSTALQRATGKTEALEPSTRPLTKESLLSVLGDLQALSAAVVNSSDASSEEDGGGDAADEQAEGTNHGTLR